jgi:hypothetical protein
MIKLSKLLETIDNEKIDPRDPRANYFPPEEGPFMCAHCEYFIPEQAHEHARCQKVAGHIEPKGCCNLYEKK